MRVVFEEENNIVPMDVEGIDSEFQMSEDDEMRGKQIEDWVAIESENNNATISGQARPPSQKGTPSRADRFRRKVQVASAMFDQEDVSGNAVEREEGETRSDDDDGGNLSDSSLVKIRQRT